MLFHFSHQGVNYTFDSTKSLDISLPLQNGNNNPNCYYADSVLFETIRAENFIGDVSEGGVVNHKKVSFTPHGNGTHTEGYAHISADKKGNIIHSLTEFLFFAQVISIYPQHNHEQNDYIVTLAEVKKKMSTSQPEALIIRTLPNDISKKNRQYSGTNPAYIEPALSTYLAASQIKHLVIDLPSVDKEVDGGLLLAHKAFWQYPNHIRENCTITELAFIPDTIIDGIYLLNLQISNFDLDVSPSKPILYLLKEKVDYPFTGK